MAFKILYVEDNLDNKLLVQKAVIRFFTDGLEQRSDGRLNVANKPKIDGRPAANMFGVLVDLNLFYARARKGC